MSHALAQTTNNLTVTPTGEENFDFFALAKRAMERAAGKSGVTRERQILKRQAVIDSMKADYRAHFAGIYGKDGKLPSAIYEKIVKVADEAIQKQIGRVNVANAISFRRGFHWAEKDMGFTERVTVTGENQISLEEQHLAATIFITQAEKRLKDLEAKKTPDYDAEKDCKARIMRLNVTKTFIEGEIKHQNELAAGSK